MLITEELCSELVLSVLRTVYVFRVGGIACCRLFHSVHCAAVALVYLCSVCCVHHLVHCVVLVNYVLFGSP